MSLWLMRTATLGRKVNMTSGYYSLPFPGSPRYTFIDWQKLEVDCWACWLPTAPTGHQTSARRFTATHTNFYTEEATSRRLRCFHSPSPSLFVIVLTINGQISFSFPLFYTIFVRTTFFNSTLCFSSIYYIFRNIPLLKTFLTTILSIFSYILNSNFGRSGMRSDYEYELGKENLEKRKV